MMLSRLASRAGARRWLSASQKAAVRSELGALRQESQVGGGERRIEAQHAKGKLTARERLSVLLDEGSFVELDPRAPRALFILKNSNRRGGRPSATRLGS